MDCKYDLRCTFFGEHSNAMEHGFSRAGLIRTDFAGRLPDRVQRFFGGMRICSR